MAINHRELKVFNKYESFLATVKYSPSSSITGRATDLSDRKNLTKLIKIIFIKFIVIIFGFRCLLIIVWPQSKLIRQLIADGVPYIGDPFLTYLGHLGGVIQGNLMLGLLQQYFILKGKSFQLQYINKIKYRGLDYRLHYTFNTKFFKKFKDKHFFN